MGTRILIADDHKIMLEGLRTLLGKEADMEVVAEAGDGQKAVHLAIEHKPDVIVIDMSMPGLNGVEASRQIIEALPKVRIIGLSMHTDRRFVMEMFKAGAAGYLLKDCAFEELIRAIRTVAAGNTYLGPGIAGVVVNEYMRVIPDDSSSAFRVLTARERQVLQLLAEGKNTKEIAFDLHVSVKTIETYRRQIMDKLDINSVAELTKYAIREGLTSLDG